MKYFVFYLVMFPVICIAMMFSSCDAHQDFPDTGVKVGHILCTDGHTYTLDGMRKAGKQPIAVVFHVNNDPEVAGNGFAVYLHELPETQFADSLGIVQGTSCDMTAMDGNENTYALYSARDCGSPLADAVFDLWRYGQSAYIPSVGQMRLMYSVRDIVNPIIVACGGVKLPDQEDKGWYWSSTEVKGMDGAKAWLYSLTSGAIQETPKLQAHPARPVITLNN